MWALPRRQLVRRINFRSARLRFNRFFWHRSIRTSDQTAKSMSALPPLFQAKVYNKLNPSTSSSALNSRLGRAALLFWEQIRYCASCALSPWNRNLVEVYARNNCPNFVATTSEFVASITALGKAQFLMGTFFGAAWRKESVRESKYSSAFRRGAAVAIP